MSKKYPDWIVPLLTHVEVYRCDDCGAVWKHAWDMEDYNNDYAQCPVCNSVDFEEVGYENQWAYPASGES